MDRIIRTASVQFQHHPGDKQANLDRIAHFVARAAGLGVEVIAFPEMCITGYWHVRRLSRQELTRLAEPVPGGSSTQALFDLSVRHGISIGAGLVELDEDGSLYNTYVVASPDRTHARHRKLHAFVSPHIASGSSYTVFDLPAGCRVGILICYDNNLIENVRITTLMGAEVLMAPHQTGGVASRSPRAMGLIDPRLWENRDSDPEALRRELTGPKGRAWLMRWLPSRAHDNGLFILFSNGIGLDDGEVRTGNAMILDPYGEILAESHSLGDDLVFADLDPAVQESSSGRRWLRARRPELYGPISAATGRETDIRSVRFGAS